MNNFKKYGRRYNIIIITIIILFQVSCNQKKSNVEENATDAYRQNYIKLSGEVQGTTYSIIYESKKRINYQKHVDTILAEFNKTASLYDSTSIISRINNNETDVVLNDIFMEIFIKATNISDETNGMFDITVGPLVDAWGFGPNISDSVNRNNIDSIRQFVGYRKVWIENNRLVKQNEGIKLDFNAIAQGYSVDLISKFLINKGIENYLVEIGGEIYASGVNPDGEKWKIGIDKPIEGNQIAGMQIHAILQIQNKAIATSGNYRKFYINNGVRYVHSINPHTGYPVKHNLLSATIISDDCMSADAYATACMVMGLEASIKFVNSCDLEAYFIFNNEENEFDIYSTVGIEEILLKRE